MGANYDLDEEIKRMIKIISNEVLLIHVDGHQDDAKDFDYDSSPLSVRLNIDMDEAAKQFLKEDQGSLNSTRITPYYSASSAALSIHGSAVTNNFDANVNLHKNGPKVETRLAKKGIIPGTEDVNKFMTPIPIQIKSIKTTELLRILNTEIQNLRQTRLEYDSQQLLINIDSKKYTAKNHTIYTNG